MDENHSAGSEIQRHQYRRRSWLGLEPSTLETDVNVRRYALLVVLARNDDDDINLPHLVRTPIFSVQMQTSLLVYKFQNTLHDDKQQMTMASKKSEYS